MKSTTKKGFTLAEVLITLGIIGVIAAMTIPSLITAYQKHQTVNRLKKTYSVLQQAIRMASDDYGDCEAWDYTLGGEEFIKQYFAPYIKLSLVDISYTYKALDWTIHDFGSPKFMLPDGGIVTFKRTSFQVPNHLIVDINGAAGSNRLGRDIFCFSFYENILTTYTQYKNIFKRSYVITPGTTSGQCSKTASGGVAGSGSYCSRLIEIDGWKISKDYPWD